MRVYAGTDPIITRRHDLVEVIPAGPKAWDRADEVRRRFVDQVKQRRSPRTTATVDQLLDRYFDQHQGGQRTVTGYRECVDKHVPAIHRQAQGGDLDADILDSLYADGGAAGTTAPTGSSSTTGPRRRTSATTGAARTGASRWATRRSERSTTS